MELPQLLPLLLGLAWLLPLAAFTVIVLLGPRLGKHGIGAGYLACGAIIGSFLLSAIALVGWLSEHPLVDAHHATASADPHAAQDEHHVADPQSYFGEWYTLVESGSLKASIGYYIDALTIGMFVMVTLIASCIHVYSLGYMHDELHEVTDHEVVLPDGHHLHRPGRFHRFFQYLSLFCFSMLGLVIAGNIAMTFVFWELVGICSYFLIGFYYERKSASNAANKAFIVNRIGDFGMIIGLMCLFGSLGTFTFGGADGIFKQVRPPEHNYQLIAPDGMVLAAAREEVATIVAEHAAQPQGQAAAQSEIKARIPAWRESGFGYGLLVVAGLGIFCGCVGKSAQFPLHVWLPDAMEGPTPVSALVHSATMVAAGVFLVGRFYPVFTPDVLLVIAYIGAITAFLAATIAIVQVDIKRVLAYSTVSQLGYMMLALGVGGWIAGLFHLFTHAFFKSLLFLCSGSVIHACHTNDMRKMGGLLGKMPYTGYTMLLGCLAIIGTGIPFVAGFSGYYSKDSIIAQTLAFADANKVHSVLFYVAAGVAAITAFYMFRLWYMTFIGEPRDHHIYEHAHESPKVMYVPLIILAVFAVVIGWPLWGLTNLLEQALPAGVATGMAAPTFAVFTDITHPPEHLSHVGDVHIVASWVAFITALSGFLLATAFYAWRLVNPGEVAAQFPRLYRFLWFKWYFDELYDAIFVQPVLFIARRIAQIDKKVIDGFIDSTARWVYDLAKLDDRFDRRWVDGLANLTANWTYSLGMSLRTVQTGRVRQYVMFIVIGTVALFVLASFLLSYTAAGN